MKRKNVNPEKKYKNYKLYTEWVSDDGQFGTGSNLLKPITEDFIYDKQDGLRDLDDNQIHDIKTLKVGDMLKRKWPYLGGDNYYHCRILHVKIRPFNNQEEDEEEAETPSPKKPADIETMVVLRLKTLLDEAKNEIKKMQKEKENKAADQLHVIPISIKDEADES